MGDFSSDQSMWSALKVLAPILVACTHANVHPHLIKGYSEVAAEIEQAIAKISNVISLLNQCSDCDRSELETLTNTLHRLEDQKKHISEEHAKEVGKNLAVKSDAKEN